MVQQPVTIQAGPATIKTEPNAALPSQINPQRAALMALAAPLPEPSQTVIKGEYGLGPLCSGINSMPLGEKKAIGTSWQQAPAANRGPPPPPLNRGPPAPAPSAAQQPSAAITIAGNPTMQVVRTPTRLPTAQQPPQLQVVRPVPQLPPVVHTGAVPPIPLQRNNQYEQAVWKSLEDYVLYTVGCTAARSKPFNGGNERARVSL